MENGSVWVPVDGDGVMLPYVHLTSQIRGWSKTLRLGSSSLVPRSLGSCQLLSQRILIKSLVFWLQTWHYQINHFIPLRKMINFLLHVRIDVSYVSYFWLHHHWTSYWGKRTTDTMNAASNTTRGVHISCSKHLIIAFSMNYSPPC